jgi:hypothetical protein
MQKGANMRMGISRIGRFKPYESGYIFTITVLAFLLMLLAQTAVGAEEGVKPYPNAPISFTELVDQVKTEVVKITKLKWWGGIRRQISL